MPWDTLVWLATWSVLLQIFCSALYFRLSSSLTSVQSAQRKPAEAISPLQLLFLLLHELSFLMGSFEDKMGAYAESILSSISAS